MNIKEECVCVIIPSYNAEAVIQRSLESLLAQTYGNWRAIVIDDGSRDGTFPRIELMAKKDNRILPFRVNHGGASAARNYGLEIARHQEAEFLTFLDADDFLEPTALEQMVTTALKTGADIVHCKYYSEYTNGYRYEVRNLFPPGAVYSAKEFPKTVFWKMITGIQMNHVCTKLYRTALFEGVMFDTSMVTGEDLLVNTQLFTRAKSYAYLAQPLYHYIRDTAGGLTGDGISFRVKFACNWRVSLQILKLLPRWKMNTLRMRICVVGRPVCLVFSKAYRILRARLGRRQARRIAEQ